VSRVLDWLLDPVPMPRIATIPVWIVLIWSLLDFVTPVLP
jgi:hypothetical protein